MKFTRTALHRAISLILLAGAVTVSPAYSETVKVQGATGANGVNGATGNPGQNGGQGGAGADAVAVANDSSNSNTAAAYAGQGGVGGRGGMGSQASATPGNGGTGGIGGNASATAITAAAGNVSATAYATGGYSGRGGQAGYQYPQLPDGPYSSGGTAFAQAFATSTTGGTAKASATQLAGNGINGTDSIMNNQVGGSTTGALTLYQYADAGEAYNKILGVGGKAQSSLTLENHTSSAVNVELLSSGGASFIGTGSGGDSLASLTLIASGTINASLSASGGSAVSVGDLSSQGVTGGNGTGIARVYGTGAADVTVTSLITGGYVDYDSYSSFPSRVWNGIGGDAHSDVFASGNGAVTVRSTAQSGNAGLGSPSTGVPAGVNGFAWSQAAAVGSGTAKVTSFSRAYATSPTDGPVTPPAGHARAESTAYSTGGGDIVATAQALGKNTESYASGGTQVQTGPVRSISVNASSVGTGRSNTAVLARIGSEGSLNTDPDNVPGLTAYRDYYVRPDAAAYAVGLPSDDVVRSALTVTPAIEQHFLTDPRSEVLGVGILRGRTDGTQDSLSASIDYVLDTSAFALDPRHLLLGFSTTSSGTWDPATSFVLNVKADGLSIFQQTYTNSTPASGQIVDLGDWETLTGHKSLLDLQFSLTMLDDPSITLGSPANTSLFVNFVFANAPTTVPVPAAGWLLGSGLLTLAAARRRRQ